MDSPHILIVDDEPFNLDIVSEYLDECDYQLSTAIDGSGALSMMENEPSRFDVILLDRMMPGMDGLEVLEKMQQHSVLRHIPVILQTGMANKQDVLDGLQAGAYYYLTKPFEGEMLLSVVKTAVRDRHAYKELQETLHKSQKTLGKMESSTFKYQLLDEAHAIASLLAGACPDPGKVVTGLSELMVNAIEHGNLGISYEEKSTLLQDGTWALEVNKRLQQPEYSARYAEVEFLRGEDYIEITVVDQGMGFDWQEYLQFNPKRVLDSHGRGIALANALSFSRLEYKGIGNEVSAQIDTGSIPFPDEHN
ncbi:MAG: response regulator [Pseudomonadales bacterium]|nr:response regulator [Pseudomonadales bacterium]